MKRVIIHQKKRLLIQKIKEYVKDKYGVNVHTSYIAQVKRMCGLDMGENYNKSKKENPEVKQCPQEKVEYIKDALRHFGADCGEARWKFHRAFFVRSVKCRIVNADRPNAGWNCRLAYRFPARIGSSSLPPFFTVGTQFLWGEFTSARPSWYSIGMRDQR